MDSMRVFGFAFPHRLQHLTLYSVQKSSFGLTLLIAKHMLSAMHKYGKRVKVSKRYRNEIRIAQSICSDVTPAQLGRLLGLMRDHSLLFTRGDLMLIKDSWYITHSGLLRIAHRKHCQGMVVQSISELCDARVSRYSFCATVYTSAECRGFSGHGDADPSNVSPLMRGCEMRVAETRAVNRALRKAYGIGICSVEELGSFSGPISGPATVTGKLPLQPVNGKSTNGNAANGNAAKGRGGSGSGNGSGSGSGSGAGNGNGTRVRDRLCQLIRQHQLDPHLVKAYATDFCGVKALRDASREQVENFIVHLADWAEKDRNALLCQLNSYMRAEAGAA
jgi:hypothetical protein